MKRKNMQSKTFKVWCRIVTIVNAILSTVRKSRDGTIYLHVQEGVFWALLPAAQGFLLKEYRTSVFTLRKKYIKPKRKQLLGLKGKFKYDNRLQGCKIVIADHLGSNVEILRHSVKHGFVRVEAEPSENISEGYYFPITIT